MKFRVGAKVQWKWLGRSIGGVVREVHSKPVVKVIKGKSINAYEPLVHRLLRKLV